MARIFEARYKKDDVIVAHQHETEHHAKIDAKQLSKTYGRAILGEVDYEKDNLIRAREYAGGVEGKWVNRSEAILKCKILLTIEDTRQEEPSGIEIKPKPEFTEEEKNERKAALQAIRDAAKKREEKQNSTRKAAEPANDKSDKLIGRGLDKALVDVICKSNVHIDSPNFEVLLKLWKGPVSETDYPQLRPKDVNNMMTKLRSLLISNDTGKAIVNKTVGKGLVYRLIDFKLEVEELV